MKKPLAVVIGIGKPKPDRGAPPSFPFSKKSDAAPSPDPTDPSAGQDDDQAEDDAQQAKIKHAYDLIEQACSVLKELMNSPEGGPSAAAGNPMGSEEDQNLAA